MKRKPETHSKQKRYLYKNRVPTGEKIKKKVIFSKNLSFEKNRLFITGEIPFRKDTFEIPPLNSRTISLG